MIKEKKDEKIPFDKQKEILEFRNLVEKKSEVRYQRDFDQLEEKEQKEIVEKSLEEHKNIYREKNLKEWNEEPVNIEKIVLDITPDEDDKKIEYFVNLIENLGIYKTLRMIEMEEGGYHLLDDFHKILVQYLKKVKKDKSILKRQEEFNSKLKTTLFEVILPLIPKKKEQKPDEIFKEMVQTMSQFYYGSTSIHDDKTALSIELATIQNFVQVKIFVSVPNKKVIVFKNQILSIFSNATILEKKEDYNIFNRTKNVVCGHMTLEKYEFLAIKDYKEFSYDPMNVILTSLANLEADEGGAIQLIIKPSPDKTTASIREKIDKLADNKDIEEVLGKKKTDLIDKFINTVNKHVFNITPGKKESAKDKKQEERNTLSQALKQKISAKLFDTNLRLIVSAETKERANLILDGIDSAFLQFENPNGSKFKLKKIDSEKKEELDKFVERFVFREFNDDERIILNTTELATVIHFPRYKLEVGNILASTKVSKSQVSQKIKSIAGLDEKSSQILSAKNEDKVVLEIKKNMGVGGFFANLFKKKELMDSEKKEEKKNQDKRIMNENQIENQNNFVPTSSKNNSQQKDEDDDKETTVDLEEKKMAENESFSESPLSSLKASALANEEEFLINRPLDYIFGASEKNEVEERESEEKKYDEVEKIVDKNISDFNQKEKADFEFEEDLAVASLVNENGEDKILEETFDEKNGEKEEVDLDIDFSQINEEANLEDKIDKDEEKEGQKSSSDDEIPEVNLSDEGNDKNQPVNISEVESDKIDFGLEEKEDDELKKLFENNSGADRALMPQPEPSFDEGQISQNIDGDFQGQNFQNPNFNQNQNFDPNFGNPQFQNFSFQQNPFAQNNQPKIFGQNQNFQGGFQGPQADQFGYQNNQTNQFGFQSQNFSGPNFGNPNFNGGFQNQNFQNHNFNQNQNFDPNFGNPQFQNPSFQQNPFTQNSQPNPFGSNQNFQGGFHGPQVDPFGFSNNTGVGSGQNFDPFSSPANDDLFPPKKEDKKDDPFDFSKLDELFKDLEVDKKEEEGKKDDGEVKDVEDIKKEEKIKEIQNKRKEDLGELERKMEEMFSYMTLSTKAKKKREAEHFDGFVNRFVEKNMGIMIGINDYQGERVPIYFKPLDRMRHLYVIGQTGTGKTTFLKNMMIQDIRNGEGICFIDPHGSDIEDILANIPPERFDDVVYFDPAHMEDPMGLNMLEYDPSHPEQKTFVVNEMLAIFEKLFDMKKHGSGGPMFEMYFRNAVLLAIDDPNDEATLMDVSRILSDSSFRREKLKKSKNIVTNQFWEKIAEQAGGEASMENVVPYITSKFDGFLANDYMRPIIAQGKSALNFREIMDSRKILLINLAKGRIGELNAHLLGLVIVGKIFMAAMSRVDSDISKLPPFYLYLDEFQNITTDTISQILSEARKYKLSLNIAHQYVKQIDEKIRDAVFGNVGSMAVFRIGAGEGADVVAKQFEPVYTEHDLVNLPNYNAYIRLMVDGEVQEPFNLSTIWDVKSNPAQVEYLKRMSWLKYGQDREIVEEIIKEKIQQT